ncbi:molybdopterin-guanine dinucleotide biosynthesis protein B [Methanocorpusculum sp.]|nr:molybdopterin-guanine dinucleotide biosynthesis protein B [Methanocorpusculum sp.]MBP3443166.1 molybdopterin-guanine dinucleotide biosynthesis protein B [Methanocorpusculaceae archaeon]MBO5367480.1 molybdopterin-guanine dinucleotide biosynthesis protein B [Methanocorpusculum sp.]MBO5430530.1 molybdopterin-guanine dinucleotide biosynthesis protein B [Methanocorpusculum sp.]MBQ3569053.1 molybdopterin-guanine dinucleotide biosynthesis protein B [Methanocorpusculum sp.]
MLLELMRLINIVGHSNSGKTTLIVRLIPMLREFGRVASLKQLGCHSFNLPQGKDTTRHFEAGAECAAGIDSEKCVVSLQGSNLFSILDYYHWLGIDYVVIEGFKEYHFPCAVIGDFKTQYEVLNNPSAKDICYNLDRFAEYEPHHK